jgi:hypothetical protein
MKLTVRLTTNQKKIIVALDRLADQLSALLDYVRKLENEATEDGRLDKAHKLNEYALQITRCLSEVQGDALQIVDDSPQLTDALAKIGEANKKIDTAIKKTTALDKKLKEIAVVLDLIAKGLSVFSGFAA